MQFEEWPQYSGGMAGSCYRQPSFRKKGFIRRLHNRRYAAGTGKIAVYPPLQAI